MNKPKKTMKTLSLFVAVILFTACSKNCDEEKEQATKAYANALAQSGGSQFAMDKLKREYDKKISDINARCN